MTRTPLDEGSQQVWERSMERKTGFKEVDSGSDPFIPNDSD